MLARIIKRRRAKQIKTENLKNRCVKEIESATNFFIGAIHRGDFKAADLCISRKDRLKDDLIRLEKRARILTFF